MAGKFVQGNWLLPNNVNANKQSNYSLDFDGSSYVDTGNADELNITESITISAWVKASSSLTDRCYLAKRGTSGDAYQISQYSNKAIGLSIWIGGSRKDLLGTTNHAQDVWYHVVGTYDGSYMRVYVNGVEENNQAQTGSIDTTTNSFRIAAENYSSAYWFKGQIDEVNIFSRALSSLEVSSLYNSGTPGNPFDLSGDPIAYYKLGETAIGQAPGGTWNWQVPNHAQSQFAMQATQLSNAFSQIVTRYFDLGNTHTFSMWLKGTGNVGRFFLEGSPDRNSNTNGIKQNIGIFITNSTTINYRINGNNLTGTIPPINDDAWHNIILVRTPTAAKVYIDGGSAINLTGTVASSENFNFKALTGSYTSSSWYGLVSNMAVWTSDRSSEVANIYNNGEPQSVYTTQPQYWYKLDNTTTIDPDFNTIRSVNSGSLSNNSYNVRSLMSQGSGPTGGLSLTFSTGNINLGTQNSISWWWSMPELYQYYNPTNFFAGDNGSNLIQWRRNTGYNYIRFTVYTGSSSYSEITFYRTDNTTLYDSMTDNNFHNYLLTRDGTNVSLYIDNNLIGTAAGTDANNNTLIEKIGGAYGGNSCCFKIAGGYYLDNFSFYNKVLSTSERATLYNSGNQSDISSLSPVYWFNADNIDTTNNNFIDLTGGSNVLPSPSLVLNYVFNNGASIGGHNPLGNLSLQSTDLGLNNPLYSQFSNSFDGTGDYIDCGNDSVLQIFTGSHSVSAWIYFSSAPVGTDNVYCGYGLVSQMALTSSRTIRYYNLGLTTGTDMYSSTALNTNSWNHVVCTYEVNGNKNIYINGIAETPTSTSGSITSTSVGFMIGARNNITPADRNYEGKIDEMAIWSTALTPAQVLEIYNNGKPNDLSALSPISWWRLGDSSYTNSSNYYVFPNKIANAPNGIGNAAYKPSISANAPKVVAPGVSSGLVELDKKGDAPNSTSNSISYNILKTDQSIYTPKYVSQHTVDNNYSMAFDGTGYFSLGSSLDFGTVNTISCWVYKTANNCVLTGDIGNGSHYNIFSGQTQVYYRVGGPYAYWNYTLPLDTWVHFAFVRNGMYGIDFYANAVKQNRVNNPAFTINTKIDTIGDKSNGSHDGGAAPWIGKIDEFAVFNKALTAGQIEFDIYKASTTANKSADFINNPNLPDPVVWYRMGD